MSYYSEYKEWNEWHKRKFKQVSIAVLALLAILIWVIIDGNRLAIYFWCLASPFLTLHLFHGMAYLSYKNHIQTRMLSEKDREY